MKYKLKSDIVNAIQWRVGKGHNTEEVSAFLMDAMANLGVVLYTSYNQGAVINPYTATFEIKTITQTFELRPGDWLIEAMGTLFSASGKYFGDKLKPVCKWVAISPGNGMYMTDCRRHNPNPPESDPGVSKLPSAKFCPYCSQEVYIENE